jgi:hypothetical protein
MAILESSVDRRCSYYAGWLKLSGFNYDHMKPRPALSRYRVQTLSARKPKKNMQRIGTQRPSTMKREHARDQAGDEVSKTSRLGCVRSKIRLRSLAFSKERGAGRRQGDKYARQGLRGARLGDRRSREKIKV